MQLLTSCRSFAAKRRENPQKKRMGFLAPFAPFRGYQGVALSPEQLPFRISHFEIRISGFQVLLARPTGRWSLWVPLKERLDFAGYQAIPRGR
jgi:hypothetical protein